MAQCVVSGPKVTHKGVAWWQSPPDGSGFPYGATPGGEDAGSDPGQVKLP